MKLTDDAKIFAAKWSFQTEGLPLWLKLDGIDNDGRPVSLPIKTGEPHLSADGLEIPVDVGWLRKLKDGSNLTVTVKVGVGKLSKEDSAVRLPLRSYSIKTFVIPVREDFSSFSDLPFPVGTPIDIGSMVITTLPPTISPQGTANTPYYYPGKIEGQVLGMGWGNKRAKLRLDLKSSHASVKFWYLASSGPISLESFDSEGGLLERITLPPAHAAQIALSKPGIRRIKLDNYLNTYAACFLDHFELTP